MLWAPFQSYSTCVAGRCCELYFANFVFTTVAHNLTLNVATTTRMTFSFTAVFAISTSVGITSYFLEKKRCLNKYLGKNSSCKIYLFKFVAIPVSKVSSQIANTISYSTWGLELPLFRIFTKLQWFFCKSSPDFKYLFLVALTNPQHAKFSKMLFCMKARGKAHPRSGY